MHSYPPNRGENAREVGKDVVLTHRRSALNLNGSGPAPASGDHMLPPWISDPRYLLALFSYSTFMNQVDLGRLVEVVQRLLTHGPVVKL